MQINALPLLMLCCVVKKTTAADCLKPYELPT